MKIKLHVMVGLLAVFNFVFNAKTMELKSVGQPARLEELQGQIENAIEGKEKDQLPNLLQQLSQMDTQDLVKRKKGGTSQILAVNPLQGAVKVAEQHLDGAKKHIRWYDPPRLGKAGFGIFSMCFGLAKGIYDITLFSDPDVDPTNNTFTILADIALGGQGLLAIFNAYKNSGSEADYEKAQIIEAFMGVEYNKFEAQKAAGKDSLHDDLSDLEEN